jgi:hypothetical protein
VPIEDKLFLSFNMYFLVFYNIHNHELLELNMVYHCCVDCGEIGTLLLSFIYLLLILRLLICISNSQTINSLLLIRLKLVF